MNRSEVENKCHKTQTLVDTASASGLYDVNEMKYWLVWFSAEARGGTI